MTLDELKALLIPVALAMRAEFDPLTQRAYHRVLKDIPPGLIVAALEQLMDAGLRFMPSAPEIQHAAEKARRQVLAAHPYEGCVECEGQKGYRTVLGEYGQKSVERCPCKARHLERLASMGVREPIAHLPGEAGVGENEPIYPTLDQLPAATRRRLQQIAEQKALGD